MLGRCEEGDGRICYFSCIAPCGVLSEGVHVRVRVSDDCLVFAGPILDLQRTTNDTLLNTQNSNTDTLTRDTAPHAPLTQTRYVSICSPPRSRPHHRPIGVAHVSTHSTSRGRLGAAPSPPGRTIRWYHALPRRVRGKHGRSDTGGPRWLSPSVKVVVGVVQLCFRLDDGALQTNMRRAKATALLRV